MEWSLRTHDQLHSFTRPCVMGIVNVSPDSFYRSCTDTDEAVALAMRHVQQGARMIDIGACSTRPGSTPVDEQVEWQRLQPALQAIRRHLPDALISVDTFRHDIARRALEEGADIINDVSGGDEAMGELVARHGAPYILVHGSQCTMHNAQGAMHNAQCTMHEVLDYLQQRVYALHRMGVADVMVDPGLGFGKSVAQNYAILRELAVLQALHCPVVVGVSHKSMLYKPLELEIDQTLPATTAVHLFALEHGAQILRAHEVAEAEQAIRIYELLNPQEPLVCL